MEVTFDRRDGVLIVAASGRLEAADSSVFLKSIRSEIDGRERAVIVDLEELSYLGSAGLRVVYMLASELEKRDARFAVCAPPKPVAKVIRLSGMDRLVAVHPSKVDALAAL